MMNLYCLCNFGNLPIRVRFFTDGEPFGRDLGTLQDIRDKYADTHNILAIDIWSEYVTLTLIEKGAI